MKVEGHAAVTVDDTVIVVADEDVNLDQFVPVVLCMEDWMEGNLVEMQIRYCGNKCARKRYCDVQVWGDCPNVCEDGIKSCVLGVLKCMRIQLGKIC